MHSVTCEAKIEIMRASQFIMSHKRSFDGHIQSLIQSIYPFLRFLATHIIHNSQVVLCCCSKMLSLLYNLEKRETKKYLAFFLSSSPSTFLFTAGD